MDQLYANESLFQVLFVTLVLGAGCAALAGRAIALTWRSIWVAVAAMIPMGMAVRSRARQMVRQYYWLYEPRGLLSWRLRQDAPTQP